MGYYLLTFLGPVRYVNCSVSIGQEKEESVSDNVSGLRVHGDTTFTPSFRRTTPEMSSEVVSVSLV